MAVTTEYSTEYNAMYVTSPATPVMHSKKGSALRVEEFNFTQGAAAGDATSTMTLIKLPAGKVRVHLAQSRIAHSAFGAARVLDIGWAAYENLDGTAVAADDNGLVDNLDVSAAGSAAWTGIVGGSEIKEFDSKEGVVLFATVAGGTIPAAATLDGAVFYTANN